MAGLTARQVDAFDRDGFVSPVAVFGDEEVGDLRRRFEAFEATLGARQALARRTDLHLVQRWAWNVVHDRRIVDPVCQLLGPDVLLWSLNWFIKEPRDGKLVTMHQDATYWGLEPHDVVTAWVALSDTSEETGPMQFLPGSHRWELLNHEDTFATDNLLSRGQRISSPLDVDDAVSAPLGAGQMSLHHVRLVHGSGPNETDDRRIGLVLRYAATHVRQTKLRDTAVLVAGSDTYGHFDLLSAPERDLGKEEMARQADALGRMQRALHSDGPPPPRN